MQSISDLPVLRTGFTEENLHRPGAAFGALAGMTFAVKDVMDVADAVTGLGHPEWRRTHTAATANAAVVDRCLSAGATLTGKTHTDELTYSLAGQNAHYGIPPNPAVPDGIPGGSSSGSASVVAAGLVDFAMGTDTGGSVRIPASYCGLFGFRPTVGAIDPGGVAALARSFDTVGWFARSAELLARVGDVLLPEDAAGTMAGADVRPVEDAVALADESLVGPFNKLLHRTGLLVSDPVSPADLRTLQDVFRRRQAWEAWEYFGSWIETNQPIFSSGIRERFEAAARVTREEGDVALNELNTLRTQLREQVQGSLWALPTAPGAAPSRRADSATIDDVRSRTLRMTALAGMAGCPQVTLPFMRDARGPVGFSLIGPAGSDRCLLRMAVEFAGRLNVGNNATGETIL